jgi:hypothetical protein
MKYYSFSTSSSFDPVLSQKFGIEAKAVIANVKAGKISACFSDEYVRLFGRTGVEGVARDNLKEVRKIMDKTLNFISNMSAKLSLVQSFISTCEINMSVEQKPVQEEQEQINEEDSEEETKTPIEPIIVPDLAKGLKRFCDRYSLKTMREKLENPYVSLWGNLIFEGTVNIVFADNAVGKTILCMGLADGISRGLLEIYTLPVQKGKYKRFVIYYDLEMSDQLILKRTGFGKPSDIEGMTEEELVSHLPHYGWVDLFDLRKELVEFGFSKTNVGRMDVIDVIMSHIKYHLLKYEDYSFVCVVDNLSAANTGLENNGAAQEMLNEINELKQEYAQRFTAILLLVVKQLSFSANELSLY